MKVKFSKDMENLRKKEPNRKYRGKPLQQTRTSRRQNFRT
jgi:hypothetical protein